MTKTPSILVCSAPKAGTYLMANVLEALGWKNSGLHLGRGEWQNYAGADKTKALADPKSFTHRGDVNLVLKKLPHGTFAVSHLGPRQIRVPKRFTLLVVLRNLRTALPSYLRFARKARSSWPDTNGWRTEPVDSAAVEMLLQLFPGIGEAYASIAEWLPHRHVVFYEALSGEWGEAALASQLASLAMALRRDPEEIRTALNVAKATDSLTKMARPTSVASLEFQDERLRLTNQKYGYEPDARLAQLHLSYAAARKRKVPCPLCQGTIIDPLPWLKDRYGLPLSFGQCRSCGHVFQDRQPASHWWQNFYEHHYWSIYGRLAASTPEEEAEASTRRYRQIFERLKSFGLSPKTLLDVGSGTGGVFSAAQSIFPACETLGSDVWPSEDPRILQIDWQETGHRSNAELVTSIHSLEHTEKPRLVLENIRRSAPDGHYLYVEVPDILSPKVERRAFCHIAHIQYFDINALNQLFRAAGYRPITVFRDHIKEWPWTIGLLGITESGPKVTFPNNMIRNRWKRWRILMKFRPSVLRLSHYWHLLRAFCKLN